MGDASADAAPDLIRPSVFRKLPGVSAVFTTRRGGTSRGPFASLNLAFHTGDVPERVQANRRRVFAALGCTPDQAALCDQVHGAHVAVVDAPGTIGACDGLVTSTPGLPLAIQVADCAAVLLADPVGGVVGACHAGWRGVVAGVTSRTVARMQSLGARPARLHVYVSPCISVDHFEVGPEVATHFPPQVVHTPRPGGRPHVDLKAALRLELRTLGVPESQTEVSSRCTAGETAQFYSHRAEQGRTGRLMGVIVLNAYAAN